MPITGYPTSLFHGPRSRLAALLGTLILLVPTMGYRVGAEPPEEPPATAKPATKADTPANPPLSLDQLSLPAGAIVVVCEKMARALELVPDGILIEPGRFAEFMRLRQQVKDLQERLRSLTTRTPSECHLTGKIEGDLALLQARFEFSTERPGIIFSLGCGQGIPTDVIMTSTLPAPASGEPKQQRSTPLIQPGPEGFLVHVEQPGNHELVLSLMVPLKRGPSGNGPPPSASTPGRGVPRTGPVESGTAPGPDPAPGGRGGTPASPSMSRGSAGNNGLSSDQEALTLDLPGSAITTVQLSFPPRAQDITLGNSPLASTLLRHQGNDLSGPLGQATRLDLRWRHPMRSGPSRKTAQGLILVRLTPTTTVTEATLTLNTRWPSAVWTLLVPEGASVRPALQDKERIQEIKNIEEIHPPNRAEPGTQGSGGSGAAAPLALCRWQVRLREAQTAPLTLLVRMEGPTTRTHKIVPVGPFAVEGVARQTGEILVVDQGVVLHLEYLPIRAPWERDQRGDGLIGSLVRQPISEEYARQALLPFGLSDSGTVNPPNPGETGQGPRCTAVFRYIWIPDPFASKDKISPWEPWLEIKGEPFRGQIRARIDHQLTLQEESDSPSTLPPRAGEGQPPFTLKSDPTAPPSIWKVISTLHIETPQGLRPEVLEVLLPEGYTPQEARGAGETKLREEKDPKEGIWRIYLPRWGRQPTLWFRQPGEAAKLIVYLEGRLEIPHVARGEWGDANTPLETREVSEDHQQPGEDARPNGSHASNSLPLPQFRGTIAQGGQIIIQVPASQELIRVEGANPLLTLARQGPDSSWNQQTWQVPSGESPAAVAITWRPYRPEVQVRSVVDVEVNPGQVSVHHHFAFRFDQPTPPEIHLAVPRALVGQLTLQGGVLGSVSTTQKAREGNDPSIRAGSVSDGTSIRAGSVSDGTSIRAGSVSDGTNQKPGEQANRSGDVLLPVRLLARAGEAHELTLEYTLSIADWQEKATIKRPSLAIPLVHPTEATRGSTKVRIWTGSSPWPGMFSTLSANEPWIERRIETVSGRNHLPALVLESRQFDAPLALDWTKPIEQEGQPWVVWPTRARIRVDIRPNTSQAWEVHFLIARLLSSALEVEFPTLIEGIPLQVFLDGKGVPYEIESAANGAKSASTRVRLRLAPELVTSRSVLTLRYVIPPGHPFTFLFGDMLRPPRLLGQPREEALPVCWEIHVPSERVVLAPENGRGVRFTWNWRGWLWAPQPDPTMVDDLERWLSAPRNTSGSSGEGQASAIADDADSPLALVVWRTGGNHSLELIHTTQRTWLLICSLGLLLLGLGLGLLLPMTPTKQPDLPLPEFPGQARLPRSGGRFWLTLVLLGLGFAALGVLRPSLVGQLLYGWQPAALVLAFLALAQWYRVRHHRNRIHNLPSFRREPDRSSAHSRESIRDRSRSGPHGRADSSAPKRTPNHKGSSSGSDPAGKPPLESTIDVPLPPSAPLPVFSNVDQNETPVTRKRKEGDSIPLEHHDPGEEPPQGEQAAPPSPQPPETS